jgi:hypothetical protein
VPTPRRITRCCGPGSCCWPRTDGERGDRRSVGRERGHGLVVAAAVLRGGADRARGAQAIRASPDFFPLWCRQRRRRWPVNCPLGRCRRLRCGWRYPPGRRRPGRRRLTRRLLTRRLLTRPRRPARRRRRPKCRRATGLRQKRCRLVGRAWPAGMRWRSPASWSLAVRSRPSRPPPCDAGCARPRSNRGGTAAGSSPEIRSSRSPAAGCRPSRNSLAGASHNSLLARDACSI